MEEQTTDIMALLQRMQQQLTFLEKKLDTLIQQSQQKPFERQERGFSKPFRPYGRPDHRPDSGHRNGPSHGPARGYGRPNHGERPREGNFVPKKKPYFGQGRNH